MRQEFLICDACGELIKKGDYAYEIKLDGGSIKQTHGGPCVEKWEIKRIPIKKPDWWIGRLYNPLDGLKGRTITLLRIKDQTAIDAQDFYAKIRKEGTEK